MTLTVSIITLNEEKNLERTLKSVQDFADEIVIVDSGSTDKTEEIAKKFGAKFVYQEWLGYGAQRNKAIDLATSDWVLNIDADEEISPELAKRIKEDFLENKKIIERNLGNEVKFFCWPWGHRSKATIKVLKELGIVGFVSTKKGTNSMTANWDMIRRIELRNYSVKKFKINLLVARNLILGKIYGWIS